MSEKQNEWSKRDIGALWKKEGKNQKFLSGYIKDETGMQTEVVIFANKYKQDNPKAPDYRIYLSNKLEESQKNTTPKQVVPSESKTKLTNTSKKVAQVTEEEEEDLL